MLLIQSQSNPAADVASLIVFLILTIIGIVLYFVPTIIAMLRKHPNIAAIMAVNLLLGWICIGWIVALIWALTAIDTNRNYR